MPKPQSKRPSSLCRPKGRGELVASLQALLANDDVDLEILRSGAPWPSATEIAGLSQVSDSNENSLTAIFCTPNEPPVIDPALGGNSYPAGIDVEPNWLSNLMAYHSDELAEQPDSFLFCLAPESISTSNSSNSTDYLSHFSSSSISQWDALLDSVCPQTPHNRAIAQSPQRQDRDSGAPQPSNLAAHTLGEGGPAKSLPTGQAGGQHHQGATDRDESASSSASGHASPRKRQRPHYAIEKRYRAGLQERFEALRDCVATLKQTQHEQRLPGNNEDTEGDDGASVNDRDRVGRMNKAEVLNQATVYIQQLQEENEVAIEHIKLLISQFRVMKRAMRQALGAGLDP